MFYSNEVDLKNANTVDEMVKLMEDNNIDSYFQVVELMATPRELIPTTKELAPFKETFTIKVHNIDIEVKSSLRYQRYTNGSAQLQEEVQVPMLGLVIQRKNAKKGLESLRLYYEDFKDNTDYLEIKANHKARVLKAKREIIANQVLEARATGVIDVDKFSEYSLHVQYDNLEAANQTKFLEDNGFTGLENLGVHDSNPDGYGHTCGRSTHIDFANKSVYVQGWSSDD